MTTDKLYLPSNFLSHQKQSENIKSKMNIKIEIPGLSAIAEAIVELAKAITNLPASVDSVSRTWGEQANITPAPSEPEKQTPAEKRKAELSEEIKALGGTPPEKGAVTKYEKVLAELKKKAEEETTDPTLEAKAEAENALHQESEEPAATEPEDKKTPSVDLDEISVDDDEAEEAEEVTPPKLEEVRMLAAVVVRCETDGKPNEELGKTKLRACLKNVRAKNLTTATPEQLTKIVPLLEKNAGITLAEAVAEATA